MSKSSEAKSRVCYYVASMAAFVFFIGCISYLLLSGTPMVIYWFLFPLPTYLAFKVFDRFISSRVMKGISIEIVVAIASTLLFFYVKWDSMRFFVNRNIDWLSFVAIVNLMICLMVHLKGIKEPVRSLIAEENRQQDLFNIFYLNTSKAHEIAMLIDNKIMKTVEREQTSEELLKHSNTIAFGSGEKASAEIEYIEQDSSKRRVFESFDVKTTKSIMLRKIYDTVKGNKAPHVGALMILKNIELTQINYDDTAILMSILQDSKLRNQGNDSIEVNLSKMIERMLDDFTIDYTFEHDGNAYVIQLPYKAKENFENGYHHNDIQLGKLSIIGIYRGEIDFANKGSVSSRFFELVTSSMGYTKESSEGLGQMKHSNSGQINPKSSPFDFNPVQLSGVHHLIDVIAIIQEISIADKEDGK